MLGFILRQAVYCSRFSKSILVVWFFLFASHVFAASSITTPLMSEAGYEKLGSSITPKTIALMSHFVTQDNTTFCGIASGVMVLNALQIPRPIDPEHPGFYYFTQQNIWTKDTVEFENGVLKKGVSLNTLKNILSIYPVHIQETFADALDEERFRDTIRTAFQKGEYMIVLFARGVLGQQGTGHASPLGAYLEKTDEVLVMDVSRYKSEPFWVKISDLWRAVHTFDTEEHMYRGVLVISAS